MKWKAENVLDLLVFLFAGCFVIIATGYGPAPARLPMAVGILCIVLAVINLISGIRKKAREQSDDAVPDDSPKFPQGQERQRLLLFFIWLLGFFIVTYILGMIWSIPLFLFSLLRFYFREGWWPTIILTLGTWSAVYILFKVIFQVGFFQGLVFN